tara:strand:- start:1981 stop:3483 length:1503 start_codon:yes stop_codon:yes gene_type:complete
MKLKLVISVLLLGVALSGFTQEGLKGYDTKKVDVISWKGNKVVQSAEGYIIKSYKRKDFIYSFSVIGSKRRSKIRVQKFDLDFKELDKVDLNISDDYHFQNLYELENGIGVEVIEKGRDKSKVTVSNFDFGKFKLTKNKILVAELGRKDIHSGFDSHIFYTIKGHAINLDVSENGNYLVVASYFYRKKKDTPTKVAVYNSKFELEYNKEIDLNKIEPELEYKGLWRFSVNNLGETNVFYTSSNDKRVAGKVKLARFNKEGMSFVNIPMEGINILDLKIVEKGNKFIIIQHEKMRIVKNEPFNMKHTGNLTILELSENKQKFLETKIDIKSHLLKEGNDNKIIEVFVDSINEGITIHFEADGGWYDFETKKQSNHKLSIMALKLNKDREVLWSTKIQKNQNYQDNTLYDGYAVYKNSEGNFCYIFNSNKKNHPGLKNKGFLWDGTIAHVTIDGATGKIIDETVIHTNDSVKLDWETLEFESFGDTFLLGNKTSYLYLKKNN